MHAAHFCPAARCLPSGPMRATITPANGMKEPSEGGGGGVPK
jgi:hypothetical protein